MSIDPIQSLNFLTSAKPAHVLRLFANLMLSHRNSKEMHFQQIMTHKSTVSPFSGVSNVLVALMAAKAEVTFDPSRVLPQQIANSITDLGFPSQVLEGENTAGEIELTVTN